MKSLISAVVALAFVGPVWSSSNRLEAMIVVNGVGVPDELSPDSDHSCLDPDKRGKPCLTIAVAAEHALLDCYGPPYCPGEKPISGDEKYRRWQIAGKVHRGEDLSHDELELARRLIGEMYNPAVVGFVYSALDQKDKK